MFSLIHTLITISLSLSLSCSFVHAQSFTPITTAFSSTVFIESSTFYIQGGATNFASVSGVYTTTPQTFAIDLSVSWSTSQPAYKSLPDGPTGSLTTAALSPDKLRWFAISNGLSRTFDIKSSTWNETLPNVLFNSNPGQGSATDPDSGLMYIPSIASDVGSTSLLALHVSGGKIDNVVTQPLQNVTMGFHVAWSAALRSILVFGGAPKFGFPKQNDNVLVFTPATGFWGSLNLSRSDSIPPQRTGSCFVPAFGGSKMILFGGLSNPAIVPLVTLNDLYILDTATRLWTKGPSAPLAEGRQGSACAVSNDQLIVWGGWDISYNPLKNAVLVYNLKTNSWSTSYAAPPIPTTTQNAPNTNATSGPASTPSPGNSDPNDTAGNKPNVAAIAGGSVGGLVFVVLGVLFVYRARRKSVSDTRGFDMKPRSPPATSTELDQPPKDHFEYKKETLFPSPSHRSSYPPASNAKTAYWADVYDKVKTRRNPATDISNNPYLYQDKSEPQDKVLEHILSQRPSRRGNAQEGEYGAQRFSQHPHADMDDLNQMIELQKAQGYVRRSPQTATEGSQDQHHDNFVQRRQEQHPHHNIDVGVTTDNILDAYFIPSEPVPMPMPSLLAQSFQPALTTDASSAFIENKALYILGGKAKNPAQPSETFMIDLSVSWNTSSPVIKQLESGPIGSSMPSALSSDGKSWFVLSNNAGYLYDTESNTWTTPITFKSRNNNIRESTAVTDPTTGLIYILDSSSSNNDIWSVDLQTNAAEKLKATTGVRGLTNSAAIWSESLKSLLSFGGESGSSMAAYDPIKNWSNLTTTGDIPPMRKGGCFVSAHGGSSIVYFGGFGNGPKSYHDIYILNATSMVWKRGPDVSDANRRGGASCAISNEQFIAWGGSNTNTTTHDDILIFNLKSNEWTPSYTSADDNDSSTSPTDADSQDDAPTDELAEQEALTKENSRRMTAAVAVIATLSLMTIGLIFLCIRERKRLQKKRKLVNDPEHQSSLTANAASFAGSTRSGKSKKDELDWLTISSADDNATLNDGPRYPAMAHSNDSYWSITLPQNKRPQRQNEHSQNDVFAFPVPPASSSQVNLLEPTIENQAAAAAASASAAATTPKSITSCSEHNRHSHVGMKTVTTNSNNILEICYFPRPISQHAKLHDVYDSVGATNVPADKF
ncbi:hypothetical protein BGX27_010842 [Mortierella sp. AM989]|nr:hypothetical protein BGX27_010842 [Mortierella sp. AM989]